MSDFAEAIRAMLLARFSAIANMPEQETIFTIGPESATALGYNVQEIGGLPPTITKSFCGVGNPFHIASLHPGQTVLDLGSGAGLDSVLAARAVGPHGKIIGIDMTEAMVAKARRNAAMLGLDNVQFLVGSIDDLPLASGTVDVAISNGVFNLCPDKLTVLREVHRVLRDGGRLQMADILLHEGVTPEELAAKGAWSD